MTQKVLLSFSALIALLPLMLVTRRQEPQKDVVYWVALLVAFAGPGTLVFVQMSGTWQTGLSSALWITVVTSTFLFGLVSVLSDNGWRLSPIFAPYMLILAGLALIWQNEPGQALDVKNTALWVQIHIIVSVVTYALVTISGISSLSAFIQEKALKSKQPSPLSQLLPSLTECEKLTVQLLAVAAATLSLGLMTGMAIQYRETSQFLEWDHKTILSITAFLVILGLLIAHYWSGLRGRLAARFVLVAYLLMTLGYPGVKFVSDVLIG